MSDFRRIPIAVTLAALVACAAEHPPTDRARHTTSKCDPDVIKGDFFGGQLTARAEMRRGAEEDSRTLHALGESPLYCGRQGVDEEYRVLERDAFGAYADVVRVSRSGTDHRIAAATTLERRGQFDGQRRRMDRRITAPEWKQVVTVIDRLQLWQTPPALPTPPSRVTVVILDSNSYMIEGRKGSLYRAVRMKEGEEEHRRFTAVSGVLFSTAERPSAGP